MTGSRTIEVNGAALPCAAADDQPLLHVLREAGLTATRMGCGSGACGACHVRVDGASVPACDTPLWAVAGKSIETLEGLARRRLGQVLREAFEEEQAGQCGFCLSGILATAADLIEREAAALDDGRVRAALDRHLCRCGAHNRIVRAVLRAAAQWADEPVDRSPA